MKEKRSIVYDLVIYYTCVLKGNEKGAIKWNTKIMIWNKK